MVEGKGKDTQDNRAVPPCYKVGDNRLACSLITDVCTCYV
jgi:hypothetical protein